MNFNLAKWVSFIMIIFLLSLLADGVGAEVGSKGLTNEIVELEEDGVDPNHSQAREKVLDYINTNVSETFAGMYIDREEKDLGVLVFLFTEEPSNHHKAQMKNLIEEPTEICFKEVAYTEQELMERQDEVNKDGLDYENFTIYHTGIDIINTKVEIGIAPYSEENAQKLYDKYGQDLINVVEGSKASTLEMQPLETAEEGKVTTIKPEESTSDDEGLNFFQKIIEAIKGWFQ
ncbi:hypothetical protein [Gracilibacillus kekensis]|uniref:Uncharacterized protein n=1 Tax=Gracilibacillus kekensis TaxID=1027249 RepID=A0A1M7Q7T1_9BACI|nr:hypothetical protein [Gracilibacillus kekensis]SHN26543.1 hypothetical protein SAMN05216179_2871 [Gracilibacillus kekensis]